MREISVYSSRVALPVVADIVSNDCEQTCYARPLAATTVRRHGRTFGFTYLRSGCVVTALRSHNDPMRVL